MSYEINRVVFDRLRGDGTGADLDLDADASRAIEDGDVRALYQLGLHPVLLNAFARSIGLRRDDYRAMLAGLDPDQPEVPRWRR